jgi:hypothetical protein
MTLPLGDKTTVENFQKFLSSLLPDSFKKGLEAAERRLKTGPTQTVQGPPDGALGAFQAATRDFSNLDGSLGLPTPPPQKRSSAEPPKKKPKRKRKRDPNAKIPPGRIIKDDN